MQQSKQKSQKLSPLAEMVQNLPSISSPLKCMPFAIKCFIVYTCSKIPYVIAIALDKKFSLTMKFG